MIEKLETIAKQVGLVLIDMNEKLAANMQTWNDILSQAPDSITAKVSAGFINNTSANSKFEMTIDVQAPPGEQAVLRTWAIQIVPGDEQTDYYNNIQLTFDVDNMQAHILVDKAGAIVRNDIRSLLQIPTTKLSRITVSNESGGDGTKQTHGQRYDFTANELSQHLSKIDEISSALQSVLQKLKQ